MHAVHVGIGGHDDFVVAQSFHAVFDVEGGLQEVELFVFIHHLLGQPVAVQRLAAQGEYGLRVDVAALGDGAAGRVALGDEDARLRFLFLALAVAQVIAAIAQLAVVQVGLFGAFAGQFRDAGYGFALLLRILYLLQHHFGHQRVLVQVVVHLGLDEVAHVFVDAGSGGLVFLGHGGPHVVAAQLCLCLAFEHRLFHVDGDGGHQSVADVGVVEILVVELLNGARQMLLQGTLMCAALCGVLAVDEGVIFLAVLVGMGEGYFDVLALEVDDVVEALAGHVVLQQVLQAVAREDALSVVDEGQSRVEVGVVAQQVLHELVLEAEADEQRVVRLEVDVGAGFLRGVLGDVAL